jgi:uncharacterized protein YdeI (YjbR/CyaY-like superfamily)
MELRMASRDPRVNAYIENSADYARPILRRLRRVVHEACPEVEETMKWRVPHFLHRGMLCRMASFKSHCAFGFWKEDLVFESAADREVMDRFGRILSLRDLPSERKLLAYVRKAAEMNEKGAKTPRAMSPASKKPLVIPRDLAAALTENAKARETFDRFSRSQRREYVEWVAEAKTEATRTQRIATALEWLAAGKPRNWKYLKR